MAHEALDTFVMEDGTTIQKGRIVSSSHPGVLLDKDSGKLFRPWSEPADEAPSSKSAPPKAEAKADVKAGGKS